MCPFRIFPLESADRPAVETLLDLVFGQDRRNRSSYRLRAGNRPCPGLSFAARMDGRLVSSVQQTRPGKRAPGQCCSARSRWSRSYAAGGSAAPSCAGRSTLRQPPAAPRAV